MRPELDTLGISAAVTTKMACARPDGVMDQEYAFLRALENVAFYQISGDRLDLQDGDGAIVLSFQGQSDSGA